MRDANFLKLLPHKFRSKTAFLKSGCGMLDVECQLPKVSPPKHPSQNSSLAILLVVKSFCPSLRPLIFFLMWTSQIFVDLLTSSQLLLWESFGPSNIDLRTQSPPFVLYKNLLRQKICGLRRLVMKLINPSCNLPDSLA